MTSHRSFTVEINTLSADEFIRLSKAVGWGTDRQYDMLKVQQALKLSSLTVVVRDHNQKAIGCGRAFSDDLLMTFIPDIFVDPQVSRQGIGQIIVEKIKEIYGHTNFFFGAKPGNELFFEKLGFKKSMQSYSGKFKKNPYYT
jgi:GNAT superfamily N-acetyltransferase